MMKWFKDKKSKFLAFFMGMLLISLICVLSLLDAPEYVHCDHIGVCEFLDLQAGLINSREEDKMITPLNSSVSQSINQIQGLARHLHFSPWWENLHYNLNSLQNLSLSTSFQILTRYINPYSNQKILCFSLKKGNKILIDQKHTSLISDCTLSQSLQIKTTSIINS